MTDLATRDVSAVLHPITDLGEHVDHGPFVVTHGEGIYAFDEHGRRYIEGCAGGAWCLALGHGEEELTRAAAEQMRKLPYSATFFGRTSDVVVELAERLKEAAPFAASKVHFVGSGSEGNDSQIRFIHYYNNVRGRPSKKKVIARIGSYHGTTGYAAALTGLTAFHADFDNPSDFVVRTATPHHYRFGLTGESEDAFGARLVSEMEQQILDENPDTVAAIMLDIVQGSGGVMIPPRTYLAGVQELARKYDIRIVADEVITGFWRTGSEFACETFDVEPHSMTLAKQLTSGYLPLGAVLIDDEMYQALLEGSRRHGVFGHGFTYAGHPVCAAVALRTLELYEERNLDRHVRDVSAHWQQTLGTLLDHPLVGEVQTVGLLAGIEIVQNKETHESFPADLQLGARVRRLCEEKGLLLRSTGDRVLLCPPLIITREQIDELTGILGDALDEAARHLPASSASADPAPNTVDRMR